MFSSFVIDGHIILSRLNAETHVPLTRDNRPLGYGRESVALPQGSAVIKFDKHVASRVFSPDEPESLDSYMMKYRKYGIVEFFDNKLDGVYVSASTL